MSTARKATKRKEPDWKAIALALAQRVIFAASTLRCPGTGMMTKGGLHSRTLELQHWKDYMADGLEMIPGLKVDRDRLHMTPAQRYKASQNAKKKPRSGRLSDE